MTGSWIFHHEPRAVVPPPDALQSRDILGASTDLALRSPSSFGLGISRVSTSDELTGPFPLYYVSPRAAEDRRPEASMKNAAGVQAGWYVVAEPGVQFEIYISMLHGENSVSRISSSGPIIETNVWVDGDEAPSYIIRPTRTLDLPLEGFLISESSCPGTRRVDLTCRKFAFCKSTTQDSGESNSSENERGTIRMQLSSADYGPSYTPQPYQETYDLKGKQTVDEKLAVKNGISVGVSRDGDVTHVKQVLIDHKLVSWTPLPFATITIFIREWYWLESRRIIDEEGYPIKYEEKKAKKEVVELEDPNVKEEDTEEPVKKRFKFEPGEVITLD